MGEASRRNKSSDFTPSPSFTKFIADIPPLFEEYKASEPDAASGLLQIRGGI